MKFITIKRLAVAGACVLSLLGVAATAGSASAEAVPPGSLGNITTPTWAGYYAVPALGSGMPTSVSARFTLPANVSCHNGWGNYPRTAALWAGIGGEYDVNPNSTLVQAGVWAWCANGKPGTKVQYAPFWEIYPNPDKSLNKINYFTCKPHTIAAGPDCVKGIFRAYGGDTIDAFVSAPDSMVGTPAKYAHDWSFTVSVGPMWSETVWYPLPAGNNPVGTMAEVITEWTKVSKLVTSGKDKGQLEPFGGLADVGHITYGEADYATGTGEAQTWHGLAVNTITMAEKEPTLLNPGRLVNIIVPGPASYTDDGWPGNNTFTTYYTGSWPISETAGQ